MKTKAIATVAIVAVLIVGVLSLNYVLTLQPHVEIASFNTTGTSSGSSYGTVNIWFVLNLTNTGTGDVEDLTITFSTNTTVESKQQLIYTNSAPPYDHIAEFEMGEPCLLGTLKAEETKDFMFYWAVNVDSYALSLTATVKSNEAILDQATVTIPSIPNVKITNFICLGTWHGTKLGAALDLFSLSYTNLGMTDIENLTVTLNTSKINETDTDPSLVFLDDYINGETYQLENLKAGETKIFEKTYFMFGAYNAVEPFTLTAILKFNGTMLDQATVTIPISVTP
jgi:hypothetical protein